MFTCYGVEKRAPDPCSVTPHPLGNGIMLKQFFVACLLGLALAGPAGAASVRSLTLGEIIDTATVAFQGTCIGNRTERDAATDLVVTYTTFAVKDVLKGTVQATHIIKQIGGKMPAGELSFRVDGVPTFAVGEDYVVLLAGVSAAGFSSPIGLGQGKFTVLQDAAGQRVSNGRDFRDMTAGMPVLPEATAKVLGEATAPVRQLGLDEFKQLVRATGCGAPRASGDGCPGRRPALDLRRRRQDAARLFPADGQPQL